MGRPMGQPMELFSCHGASHRAAHDSVHGKFCVPWVMLWDVLRTMGRSIGQPMGRLLCHGTCHESAFGALLVPWDVQWVSPYVRFPRHGQTQRWCHGTCHKSGCGCDASGTTRGIFFVPLDGPSVGPWDIVHAMGRPTVPWDFP